MRSYLLLFGLLIFASCDKARVYEKDYDFANLIWTVNEVPVFEFNITDSAQLYNVYYKIRNSNDYPYARIFLKYNLISPSQKVIAEKLVSSFLFDQKTGVPLGSSGIGDKFDHQFPLLAKQKFSEPGKYKITFEQFMRTDTLKGLEALGLRVEKSE